MMSRQRHSEGRRRAVLLGLLASAVATSIVPSGARAAGAMDFPIFDALGYRGKPDLSSRGLIAMRAVAAIWSPGAPKNRVDERGIAEALDRLPPHATTVYVDIEDWPLLGVSASEAARSVDNYLTTAAIIRQRAPDLHFGFYGVAPCCVYWPIMGQNAAQLAEWKAINRALAPLSRWVDFVLPSLYTFYEDPAGWSRFALATIEEARQYGKPVYPFLWNQYFDGNRLLRGSNVREQDWEEELMICRQHADGIVLWGGEAPAWNEQDPWWQHVLRLQRG